MERTCKTCKYNDTCDKLILPEPFGDTVEINGCTAWEERESCGAKMEGGKKDAVD